MARRRRRRAAPQRAPNLKLIVFQVLILVGALVAVIGFRDSIGTGTGALVDSLSSEDIAVEQQAEEEEKPKLPAERTDDTDDTEKAP